VDSVLDQSFTTDADISQASPLFIGKRWSRSESTCWFNGKIDNVRIYDGALSAARVWQLYVEPSLAHLWEFDETSGTTAHDSAGATNGTFNGTDPCWVMGNIGGAIDLNGVSDYFTISGLNPGTDYNNFDTFTVAGWFKTSQSTGIQTIMGQWGQMTVPSCPNCPYSNLYFGWQVLVENSHVVARFGTGGTSVTEVTGTSNVVSDGDWHQFALVYPTRYSNATLYVGGNSEGTPGAKPFTVGPTSSRIGDGNYAIPYNGVPPVLKGGPFCGMVDEVMIFNRTLTADEVYQLYIAGR
jgi:hypothetical protein